MYGLVRNFLLALCIVFPAVTYAAQKEKPVDIEAAKSCTQECTKKHGNGMNRKEKYDAQAYEQCMNECPAIRRSNSTKKSGAAPKK